MEVSSANRATVDAYTGLTDEFYGRLGEDGGFQRRTLLNPAVFRVLGDVSGASVLDAGCGHGYLSRLLADRGARVAGIESATCPLHDAGARRTRDRPLEGSP